MSKHSEYHWNLIEKLKSYKMRNDCCHLQYCTSGFTLQEWLEKDWLRNVTEPFYLASFVATQACEDIGERAYYFVAAAAIINEWLKDNKYNKISRIS